MNATVKVTLHCNTGCGNKVKLNMDVFEFQDAGLVLKAAEHYGWIKGVCPDCYTTLGLQMSCTMAGDHEPHEMPGGWCMGRKSVDTDEWFRSDRLHDLVEKLMPRERVPTGPETLMTFIDDIPGLTTANVGPGVTVHGCTAQIERDGEWVQCALPGGHQGHHVYNPGDLYLAIRTLADFKGLSWRHAAECMGVSAADADALVLAARAEGIQ